MAEAERKPATVDPATMPIDDLKALIDSDDMPPSREPEAEEERSDPDPEPAETEIAEESTAAPEAEASPDAEPEVTDLEALRLQIEEANKRAVHFEKVAGRVAGEKGFLEQQLKKQESDIDELRSMVAQRLQGDGEIEDEPRPRRATTQRQATVANSETDAAVTQLLLQQEAQRFFAAHPEALKKDSEGNMLNEFEDDMQEELKKFAGEAENLLSLSPLQAVERTRKLLDAAWSQVDLNRTVKRRQDLERRRADSAKSLKDKKRAAAVTPSAGGPAEPPPKPLDPMKMPLEDLKALIERMNEE